MLLDRQLTFFLHLLFVYTIQFTIYNLIPTATFAKNPVRFQPVLTGGTSPKTGNLWLYQGRI